MKFGTDGVRGIAGVNLSAEVALRLAMSAGIYFKKTSKTKKILVGKDTRKSGYMLENAVVSGLTAVGYNVIQVGPMPTPAISFLTTNMRCDAGVMISASHNSFEDNGIKFFDFLGFKLDNKVEKEIENIYNSDDIIEDNLVSYGEIGSSKRIDDVVGRYIVHLKTVVGDRFATGIRIVLDCANGASYNVAPTIFNELDGEVFVINNTPNGLNINHKCGSTFPQDLQREVVNRRADIGFAFDGDSDRLVVVDEKGEVVEGDLLLASLGMYLKDRNELKNNLLVTTIMSNYALDEYCKTEGLKVIRSDVGDKHVFKEIIKNDGNYGGEQSGHIIFFDNVKTGDGILSALMVLSLLIDSNKLASKILRPFKLYPQITESIIIKQKKDFKDINGLSSIIDELESDGLKSLIRYSGTEPKVRITIEGSSKKLIREYTEKLSNLLLKELN